jgi:hypothetical protein
MKQPFSSSSIPRRAGLLATLLVLAGCGGGGGDDPVAVPTLPLAAAWVHYVQDPASYTITFSGTARTAAGQELPFSGSGNVTEATTASTFEGVAAQRKSVSEDGQFVILGTTYPVTAVNASYFDLNNVPLGSVGEDGYCVVTSYQPLPASARPGHNGTWFSSTCYSDDSKTVRTGSVSTSWVMEPESDSSGRFKLLTRLTDSAGGTLSSSLTVRINTAAQIRRLEESGTLSGDGVTLNYTGVYP